MNNTTLHKVNTEGWDTTLFKVATGFYISTGTFGLIGNSIVIAVMLKKYKKASIFKWLLAHLAVCDILFAVFLLVDVPNWVYQYWVYTDTWCKVIPSFQFVASIAAESTVVVIAIERYKGISKPLKVQWNKRDLCLALVVAWLFAVISVSPYCMVLKTVTVHNVSYCVEDWNENSMKMTNASFIYSTYTFVGNFIIPMLILAVLYGRIIFIIRKPIQPIPCFEQIFRKRREKDIRITKLLITVVAAFALCVLPNHLGHFILAKANLTEREELVMRYLTLIPYPFQCMINPIIYSIVDKQFRRDVKLLISCKHKQNLHSRNTTVMFLTEGATSWKKYPPTTHGRMSTVSIPSTRTSECAISLRSARTSEDNLYLRKCSKEEEHLL